LPVVQCTCRCMANQFPTHFCGFGIPATRSNCSAQWEDPFPHYMWIYCVQCFAHMTILLFIHFMFQAMSCCEPLGTSWGKGSKLLSSTCVFRLNQGRNLTRLLYSGACCCCHSWWTKLQLFKSSLSLRHSTCWVFLDPKAARGELSLA
jgi:hypothetical protein